jgi:endonuclease IV
MIEWYYCLLSYVLRSFTMHNMVTNITKPLNYGCWTISTNLELKFSTLKACTTHKHIDTGRLEVVIQTCHVYRQFNDLAVLMFDKNA